MIHVDEEFLECYVLKRPSRIVLLDKADPRWESVKACTCYVGKIDRRRFGEIREWLKANGTGTVVHNYPKGAPSGWHTGFGFTDSRSFFAFKLFFEQSRHRDDLNLY